MQQKYRFPTSRLIFPPVGTPLSRALGQLAGLTLNVLMKNEAQRESFTLSCTLFPLRDA